MSPLTRAIASLASGTVVATGITVLVTPIVTHLYEPRQIGAIALIVAVSSLWGTVAALRFDSALLIAPENDLSALSRLCVTFVLINATLSAPGLFALQRMKLMGIEAVPSVGIWSGVILVLGYGLSSIMRAHVVRTMAVRHLVTATLSRSISYALVRIGAGTAGLGFVGLCMAEIASILASTVTLGRNALGAFAPLQAERPTIRVLMSRYGIFPKFELPSTILDQFALILPLPIIVHLYGPGAAGLYALADRVLALPAAQIGTAFGDVFQMKVADLTRSGEARGVQALFWQFTLRLAIIGLPIFAIFAATAPSMFGPIMGQKWAQSGMVVAILTPWAFTGYIVAPLSRLISILRQQRIKLFNSVFALVAIAIAYAITVFTRSSFMGFLVTMTIVRMLSYVIYFTVLVIILGRIKPQDMIVQTTNN